jgi:hypothetical protein
MNAPEILHKQQQTISMRRKIREMKTRSTVNAPGPRLHTFAQLA